MAHLLAFGGGETGDVGHNRLGHMFLGPSSGILFGKTADFADHHYGLGVRVGFESLQRFEQCSADDGIATGSEACGEADIGQFAHQLVGQGAGLGNQSERAAANDVIRNNAQIDARIAERDQPGAVRADNTHALAQGELNKVGGIRYRNAFGDDHDKLDAGLDRFDDGGLGELRRHEHHAGFGASGFTGLVAGGEHRHIHVGAVLGGRERDGRACLARIHTADDVGAGLEYTCGVGHALMTGHTLNDNGGTIFNEQHQRISLDWVDSAASSAAFCAAPSMVSDT